MNECGFCGNPLYEGQAGSVHVDSLVGSIYEYNSSEAISIKDNWYCDFECFGNKIAELRYHANHGGE